MNGAGPGALGPLADAPPLPADAPRLLADATDALARTAVRYRACQRFTRHYVASKLRRDPIHHAVLAMAADHPFGGVADIGCGRGQVGIALLEAGGAVAVTGLDWAGRSLDDARRAGAGLAFTAQAQDLATRPAVPDCDTALLIDVLYLLRQDQAVRLLGLAAAAARRRLVVRTLDVDLGLRSKFHLAMEHLGRPFWPHAGAVVDPAPLPVLAAVMEAAGFTVTREPCWQGTPFANVLMTARKTAA
jgi:SAM-dependent methyltransferase